MIEKIKQFYKNEYRELRKELVGCENESYVIDLAQSRLMGAALFAISELSCPEEEVALLYYHYQHKMEVLRPDED